MKRSDLLRRIARSYKNCDGSGDNLIEALLSMECLGTCHSIDEELRLAADDLDQLERLKEQSQRPRETRD